MIVQLSLFLVGLISLTIGADWLVTAASSLAERRGVSPLMVGLTVVAFGTSAPELLVAVSAAFREKESLAVGTVMGSTIANVALIVGLGALIRPISVHHRLIQREGPLLILVLAIVTLFSWNEMLGRWEGLALMAGFLIYLATLLRWGIQVENRVEKRPRSKEKEVADHTSPVLRAGWRIPVVPRIIFGLILLLVGANWLVDGAVAIAEYYNVSEEIIGATIVAVGTSLPELASTVAAAARKLGDIAIGNVIGSNIFNLGLVLGAAATVRPLPLSPTTVGLEVIPALIFCVGLLAFAYTGSRINRLEAILLLAGYVVWSIFLI